MLLHQGVLLSFMVARVFSGLVSGYINQEVDMLLSKITMDLDRDMYLETCSTSQSQDNPSFALCAGAYDLSVHVCKSGTPPETLFKNPSSEMNLQMINQDQSICSAFMLVDVLVLSLTNPQQSLRFNENDYLPDGELCDALRSKIPMKIYHLCMVIDWGSKLLAVNAENSFDDLGSSFGAIDLDVTESPENILAKTTAFEKEQEDSLVTITTLEPSTIQPSSSSGLDDNYEYYDVHDVSENPIFNDLDQSLTAATLPLLEAILTQNGKLSDVEPELKHSNNYDDDDDAFGEERGYPEEKKLPINDLLTIDDEAHFFDNFDYYAFFPCILIVLIFVMTGYLIFFSTEKKRVNCTSKVLEI